MAEPQTAPPDLLSSLAYQTGGLGAIPQIQQSQYLAEALRNLQQGSAQNIQTKGALASNLLANALLQFGNRNNNAAMLKAIGGQQAAQLSSAGYGTGIPGIDPSIGQAALAGAGGSTAPSAPAGAGMAAPASAPPSAAPAGATNAPVMAAAIQGGAPAAQARLSGSDFYNNFFVPHEGRLNKSDANGSPSVYGLNEKANPDVTSNMTQAQVEPLFEQRYFDASGANNLPPQLAAIHADTYALNPSWATSILKQSGGNPQTYMALREQHMQADLASNPAVRPYAKAWENRNRDLMAYASGLGGQGQPQGTGQIGGGPGSYQVASNGPTPPPPLNQLGVPASTPQTQGGPFPPPPGAQPQSGPINANTPPPMAAAMQAQQPQPAQQGPLMKGPRATPQETASILSDLRAPPGSGIYQRGVDALGAIHARATTPIGPTDEAGYNAQGQLVSARPFTDVAGPANAYVQRDFTGKISSTPNAGFGSLPQGAVLPTVGAPQGGPPPGAAPAAQGAPPAAPGAATMFPGFGLRPLVTPQDRAAAGINPQDHAVYAMQPGGQLVKQAEANVPLTELSERQERFTGSDPYKDYNQSLTALNGLQNAISSAGGPNNMVGAAAIMNFVQSFGINPRGQSAADELSKTSGIPSQFATLLLKGAQGGMPMSDMMNILAVVRSNAAARENALTQYRQADTNAVRSRDPTLSGVGGEDIPPIPPTPSFGQPNVADPIAAKAARLGYHAITLPNGQRGWTR